MSLMSDARSADSAWDRRRWLILGVIALAQLMVVLDLTVMNIALPSAQRALHFTTVDRQWVVTAYSLAFGSLLLLGGRLADLLGRKVTFLAGLAGFAGVSAIGGASVNFTMLVTARACQGAFAALLVPSALSLLTTTFTGPKGPRQGIRHLRGDRRGRRRGGPAARRRADPVPVLAVDDVREPDLRRSVAPGGCAAAQAPAIADPAEAGHPGRAAGFRRRVLPGLRVLQRGHAQLVRAVHLRVPGRRRRAWRAVRAVAGAGCSPAAAAPGGARPQPGRRLPVDAHRLGRAVRDLLVLDLLPAADARLLAARDRCGVPAAQRRPHYRVQPVHDRADAAGRAQAAGRVRDAGRGRRGGVAGPAGPAHRLWRGRARPD